MSDLRLHSRILCISLLAITVMPLYAQPPQLELAVSVRKGPFVVGEPVNLELRLRNRGASQLQIREPEAVTQTVRYTVITPAGVEERYLLPMVKEPRDLVPLDPGKVLPADELILYNFETNRLAFPGPGKYTVRCEFINLSGQGGRPAPATVDVHVISDPVESEGSALFARQDVGSVFAYGKRDSAALAAMTDFAARNPSSPFTPYAVYAAALFRSARVDNTRPDYEGAQKLVQQILKPDFQLYPQALLKSAALFVSLNSLEDARRDINRLIQQLPDTASAGGARKLQARLERKQP